jgi:hypothetical protein
MILIPALFAFLRRIFSGFKSQWIMPYFFKNFNAIRICIANLLTTFCENP